MNLSWLDGILPILRWAVNGTSKGTPLAVNLTGTGVTSTVADDTLTVNFEGGSGGGNATAEYLLSTADGTLPNSRVLTASSSVSVTNATGTTTLACIMGTTSGTCCAGNDSRLSDARTPTAHAASHKHGGSDEIATTTAAANAIPKAGAGGTLAVNWLPTGTSSATVCIGNDARLAPTPSESATGGVLVSSGAAIKAVGPAGRWWNSAISGISPSSTATSTSSVTMTGPFIKAAFRVGEPIRVLEKASIIASSQTPLVQTTSITAIKGSILDYRLSFYAKTVLVTGTTFRFDFYSEEACTNQIGSSATFDANVTGESASLAITAANGSGLAGAITAYSAAESRTAGLIQRISQGRTAIVTAYDSSTGLLTFAGQAVSTASGNIVEVWRGAPELVVPYDASIPGVFSGATTSTGLKDRTGILRNWDGPNATLCQVVASQGVVDTGATQPKIAPVVAGTQLIADGSALALSTADTRVATAVQMTAASMEVKTGDRLELRIVAGTNANARDLSATYKMVLD